MEPLSSIILTKSSLNVISSIAWAASPPLLAPVLLNNTMVMWLLVEALLSVLVTAIVQAVAVVAEV
jgi:hypothetical protein